MEGAELLHLANLLRQHGDKILNGSHQLSLTATLLQYMNNAFCMVVEHDAHSSFQVIHTTNTKLHDLHFLHDFIQKVEGLVISHGATTLKGNVDISKFRNLRQLELRRVPLHMVTGLPLLQHQLRIIGISQSISRPSDFLGGGDDSDETPAAVWPQLYKLSLPQNTISSLDSSFRLATSLKEVDLCHNQLYEVTELEVLPNLTVLNLSYNRLMSIPRFHRFSSRNLKSLAMAHNQLENLTGLEHLISLQVLQISWNCLLEASSLAPLSRLASLRQLRLEGNPLSRHENNREQTVRHLHPSVSSTVQFKLNGIVLSDQEKRWLGLSASLMPTTHDIRSKDTSTLRTQQQRSIREARRGVRVREAEISDQEEAISNAVNNSISTESFTSLVTSTEHLETKRQIESLREKLGDKWLVGMPGALGIADIDQIREEASSSRCHEAQAWLDSQQRPPQTKLGHSPINTIYHSEQINKAKISLDEITTLPNQIEQDTNSNEETQPNVETTSDSGINDQTEDSEETEEEEEGSEPPYLVQRKINCRGQTITKDYFFIVGASLLVERDTDAKCQIVTQWPIDSLQSCEHPTLCQVILTFDTVRRDKERRDYTLEASEVQRLCRSLGSRLESRSLKDMNQVAFHCMRCSTKFSAEITADMDSTSRCPSCSSAVVVQDDGEHVSASQSTAPPHVNQLSHSDSQSSIGVSCISTAESASKVLVAAEVHSRVPDINNTSNNVLYSASKKSSAASLDQSMGDSGLGLTGHSRFAEGADSDIEVLSNPSQSSIEVLPTTDDNHSREQSVAPITNSSQMSSTNQAKSPHGLTESSSSGSMTDSVCTAYESGNANANVSLAQPSSSLSGVLGSFLQRYAPTFSQQSMSPTRQSKDNTHQPVLYNYSDFARVDHRLKLHLCMSVLNHDSEILTALLRCWILAPSSTSGIPFPGILIISSQSIYIRRIQGIEGDNPDRWLINEGVWPLSQLQSLSISLWKHGVEAIVQHSNSKTESYTFILGDVRHAPGFLSYVTGVVPATCQIQRTDTGDLLNIEEPLPWIGNERAVHFTIVANFLTSEQMEKNEAYGPVALAVSESEISVSREDLRLISDQNSTDIWAVQKSITSLMEVEISSNSPWLLKLHFTEEMGEQSESGALPIEKVEGTGCHEEEWTMWFVSQRSRQGVIEALLVPWQKFFEVPLDVRLV